MTAASAFEVLRQVVGDIDDDQLGRQTPCRDYDVAALADHVVDSITRISAAAGVVVVPKDLPVLRRVVDTGSTRQDSSSGSSAYSRGRNRRASSNQSSICGQYLA